MSEIQRNQPSSRRNLPSYRDLLTSATGMEGRIAGAVSRLGMMTGKILPAEVLDGWIQNLASYSPEKLIGAFERVEREVAAFPAVSHVVQILDRAEFDDALALVLRALPRHGVKWEDKKAWKSPDQWDHTSAAAVAKNDRILIPGVVHPAEAAPTIPPRMVRALGLYGQDGSVELGLVRLRRDWPGFWTESTDREAGQHSRQAAQMERDLWECWRRAQ